MPNIRVRPYNGTIGPTEWPSNEVFTEPGAYLAADGRLFIVADSGCASVGSPQQVHFVVTTFTAAQAAALITNDPQPAHTVDVHRLLDQILDIQGARIDGIGIRDLVRRTQP